MTRKPRRTKKANLVLPLILVLLLTSVLLTSPTPGLRRASASNYLTQGSILDIFEIDGNPIDSSNPGLDWSTLNRIPISTNVAPLVAHTGVIRDPAPSSIFSTAGSRDDKDISEWRHSTGSVQDKGDISNAYAAAFRTASNEVFFLVGADRVEAGDGTIGFWVLQKRVFATADGTFRTGPSTTDPLATHTIGDILVLVEFSQGGSLGTGRVFKWSGPGGAIGGTIDLIGTFFSDSDFVGPIFFVISNRVPEKAPWLYVPQKSPAGIIPGGAFFEGGVNITALGLTPLCNPTIVIETRSSASVSAPLQDFVLASFRPLVSVPSATICEATPTTLPFSLSEGTPPYSLSTTATGGLEVFLRGITIGATTPGGPPGTYQITTTATDTNGCIGSSAATLTILPKPVCNVSAPDPLPVCGSQNNTLSGPAGLASYSWSVVSSNNDWAITSGANSQTVTYTAGSGSATFKLVGNGSNSCTGTCEVTFTCR